MAFPIHKQANKRNSMWAAADVTMELVKYQITDVVKSSCPDAEAWIKVFSLDIYVCL